jgi:hypothetical protein
MEPKAAIGGIALMCLGIGIPLLLMNSWVWGVPFCGAGLVLLFISCRDWIYGKPPGPLDIGIGAQPQEARPLSTDQKTFEALKTLLPEEEVVRVCGQSFAGRFEWDADALGSFLQLDDGPSHAFLDESLEELRQRLHAQIAFFWDRAQRYSTPAPSNERIRFFDYGGDTVAYDARRKEVIDAAEMIRNIYHELVLTARRKFEREAPVRRLTIQSARYGTEDGSAEFEDVTTIVQANLRNNAVNIEVSDQTFLEAIPGLRAMASRSSPALRPPKYLLKVVYKFGDDLSDQTTVRYAGERLVLPEP